MRALLEARDLAVRYPGRRSVKDSVMRRPTDELVALDGVSLNVGHAEIVGLVGESGSGKSTLARCLVGLQQPSRGAILLEGAPLPANWSRSQRRRVQMVFQNPYASLNPRLSIGRMLREVVWVHHGLDRVATEARCVELLDRVGLPKRSLDAYPRQLSGGQRQRVGIARALATDPDVLVADEPVSALDVSVRARVLELLLTLRDDLGLAILLISHDLSVVRHVSDRVAVMYLGRIVESADVDGLFGDPRHPYTEGLFSAIPRLGSRRANGAPAVVGAPPSPYRVPSGCRFHPRCPIAQGVCATDDPALLPGQDPRHEAACHFAWPSGRQAS